MLKKLIIFIASIAFLAKFSYPLYAELSAKRLKLFSRGGESIESIDTKKIEGEIKGAWGASPFSNVTSASVKDELAATRRQKMKALGYATPDQYYMMSLGQLEALAKKGDAYAMAQLGEQYYSEVEFIKNDKDFDRNENAKKAALNYFEGAFLAGYTHLASVISLKMIEENNLIDAYAWNLVSKSFNDHANDALYEKYSPFANMTEMQKAAAQAKFDAIWQRLVERGN